MKRTSIYLSPLLILSALLLAACATPSRPETSAGLPNPAAVHCQEQGYEYEIRSDDAGNQYGVCRFPDGSECDAWAYFRGECGPGLVETAPAATIEPATSEAIQSQAVNLVAAGKLDQTTRIDIYVPELLAVDPDVSSHPRGQVKRLASIIERGDIARIVATLDTLLPLEPRRRCPAFYSLEFHLPDGSLQEFGYGCDPQTADFLRGGQDFFQGMDVRAPDGFNQVMQAYVTLP